MLLFNETDQLPFTTIAYVLFIYFKNDDFILISY